MFHIAVVSFKGHSIPGVNRKPVTYFFILVLNCFVLGFLEDFFIFCFYVRSLFS